MLGRVGHLAIASLETSLGGLGTMAVDWITSIGPGSANSSPAIAAVIVALGIVIWVINELSAGGRVSARFALSANGEPEITMLGVFEKVATSIQGAISYILDQVVRVRDDWKHLPASCSCIIPAMIV